MARALAVALTLALAGCRHAPPPETRVAPTRLVILHTNDTHGSIWGGRGRGDASRRAGLIDEARAEAARDGAALVLLDAGDVRTGSLCSDRQTAAPDFEAMAVMGYDAMTLGNHELDVPFERTLEQRMGFPFPLLGANVLEPDRDEPIFQPFVILERGSLRIAVLGLTTTETPTGSTFGALAAARFVDPIETARRWVPELRERADVVVVLSHEGFDEDRALAAAVPGIDVVVGGHSHTALESPVREGGALIVQAGSDGRFLGRLDLDVGPDGVSLVAGRLIPVTGDAPSDPAVAEVLRRHDCPEAHEVVARAAEAITRTPLAGPGTSSALANLVGLALREATGSELSLMNRGGLRADIEEGDVTLGAVHAVLPFTNTLVVLGPTGADLDALARLVARRGPSGAGVLLPGGMDWVLGPGESAGVTVDGVPLDESRTYRLVVSSFLADGGDGYELLRQMPRLEAVDTTPREALAAHLRRVGTARADRTTHLRWTDPAATRGEALGPPSSELAAARSRGRQEKALPATSLVSYER